MPSRHTRRTRRSHKRSMSKFVTRSAATKIILGVGETHQLKLSDQTVIIDNVAPGDVHLNDVEGGSDTSQRIGSEIQMQSIYIEGYAALGSSVMTAPYMCRILLYSPLIPNSNILANLTTVSQIDKNEFNVYSDKLIQVPWINQIGSNHFQLSHSWKPFRKVVFSGIAGTTITKGDVHMVLVTDAPVTEPVSMHWRSTLNFKDL